VAEAFEQASQALVGSAESYRDDDRMAAQMLSAVLFRGGP
jgi:hypothetical protein